MPEGDETLRRLAAAELRSLLASEPRLAKAFAVLARAARARHLKTFCREGVSYTRRRAERVREALAALEVPAAPRASSGMAGLIADALAAARSFPKDRDARDAALLAAVERISHYGLGIYTSIDRYLRAAGEAKARRVLIPSTKEKRDAIGEASRMARHTLIARLRARASS